MTDAPAPRCCQPVAFAWFLAALPEIDSDQGLVRAAVAIARHQIPEASREDVEQRLDELATQVRRRIHGDSPQAVLAHLHEVLFDEVGFRGNRADYYNPRNSYLPTVLQSHRGIPITLSLVYKAVGGRLGLPVQGLNCPGHFLVEVLASDERMIVDPFHRGIVLTHAEARARLQQATGTPLPDSPDLFRPATHTHWIARMLHNLQGIFSLRQNPHDLQAMVELEQVLTSDGRK
jgi:regulator of sirC expression with transglutaminase-like and TPR domain